MGSETFWGPDFGQLQHEDPEIAGILLSELERARGGLQLIASENFTSPAVLAALGSTLSNKYAEGYPGKRYYGGCAEVDKAEIIGIERAKELFGAEHANLQPHSGASANLAAYGAFVKPGETVLDLGSGGGFDAFLAARAVGASGHVIGVDMTPAMVSKARANADSGNYSQVDFRLGEIEHLPVADATVDVIISNCVINLSPDKPAVFREAFRVLKSGGRLAISDVVAFADLPDEVRGDLALYSGCMAGASLISELEAILDATGFVDIAIDPKDDSRNFIERWAPGRDLTEYVVSATIAAVKP